MSGFGVDHALGTRLSAYMIDMMGYAYHMWYGITIAWEQLSYCSM